MESGEKHGILALVERLGSASRMLNERTRYAMGSVSAGLARLMENRCADLLEQSRSGQAPVLFVYMSDGWACDISQTKAIPTDASSSRVTGRFRAEFLAEKVILKTFDATGSLISCLKVLPPRGMTSKSGWDIFGASMEQFFFALVTPLADRDLLAHPGRLACWWHGEEAAGEA